MDATRRRRTRDEARRLWYGRWRQERFARSAFQPGVHGAVKDSDHSTTLGFLQTATASRR